MQLTYSNRTEALLDALANDLAAAKAKGRSPFEPVRIVVPNRNVETWLKHGLARRLGIAANLEVHLLRRFVGELLRKGMRGAEAEGGRLVDGPLLNDLVLSLLLDDSYLSQEGLSRVRSYLYAAGDAPDPVDLRRVQLASELSRLFDEYGFSRPEMLAAWRHETLLGGTPYAETEEWQRRIWLDLFGEGGLAARRSEESGERLILLPQVLERLRELQLGDGAPTYLFGVSYFASAFHRILAALAAQAELHVYTLNPCMEFWEDVETRRSQRRHGEDLLFLEPDPFGLESGDDTPALTLWGRPGRENIRFLNALTDCDFREVFLEPSAGAPSLLAQLQRDILVREPRRKKPAKSFDFAEDRSVQILACPGVRRECETIAAQIWSLVHEDAAQGEGEPLRFNDIAVLVAGSDPQTYFTQLAAVFEETYQIPFNRSGSSFGAESRIAEAIELFLALPFGSFSRSEVLGFATHPNVIAAFPETDPTEWGRWCDELGIVRGEDREALAGSYVEGDLLSWGQGLRRMALGEFFGEIGPLHWEGESYLPERLPSEAAASFGAQCWLLVGDLSRLREKRLTPAQWGESLASLVEAYVLPRSEAEERDLDRALRTLRGLGELHLDGRAISYRIASELALQGLRGLGGSAGQYLAGGVVVSTLQPMRAIPFRAIFIAGLGQGRFPSAERRNSMDLRLARPRAGDISPRESDQYMFLEALLCARDRITLSYVARDPITGNELLPSPVLVELERMLSRGYGVAAPIQKIPLRRFQEADEFAAPQALREARALELREELLQRLAAEGGDGTLPELDALLEALPPAQRIELEGALGIMRPLASPGGEAGEEAGEPIRVSRSVLRAFLQDPLQGSARQRLGMREEEEDPRYVEDEPFAVDRLVEYTLLQPSFLGGSVGGAPLEAILDEYEALAEEALLDGALPLGCFGTIAKAAHLEELKRWGATLQAASEGGASDELEVIRFGPGIEERPWETIVPPLQLEVQLGGRRRTVEIVGATEPLIAKREGSLLLKTFQGAGAPVKQEAAFRSFLDHVLLVAADQRSEGPHSTWFANTNKTPYANAMGGAITREEARSYLGALLEDLLGGAHDYWLPVRAVFSSRRDGASIQEEVEKLAANERVRSYGPVRGAKERPPPKEEEAAEMVERRFGLFFKVQAEV